MVTGAAREQGGQYMSADQTNANSDNGFLPVLRVLLDWRIGIAAATFALPIGATVMKSPAFAEPFPYKLLSSEESVPFLKHGKPPIKDEHKVAVKRWPGVRSCLVESERKKQKPDIRRIDWGQLYTVEEADVCLFRIFSSIGSMKGSIEWLLFHGFKIDGPYDSAKNLRYLGKRVKAHHVNGSIPIGRGNGKAKFPTCCLKSLWVNLVAYSQTLSVTWTIDDKLVIVYNGYSIK